MNINFNPQQSPFSMTPIFAHTNNTTNNSANVPHTTNTNIPQPTPNGLFFHRQATNPSLPQITTTAPSSRPSYFYKIPCPTNTAIHLNIFPLSQSVTLFSQQPNLSADCTLAFVWAETTPPPPPLQPPSGTVPMSSMNTTNFPVPTIQEEPTITTTTTNAINPTLFQNPLLSTSSSASVTGNNTQKPFNTPRVGHTIQPSPFGAPIQMNGTAPQTNPNPMPLHSPFQPTPLSSATSRRLFSANQQSTNNTPSSGTALFYHHLNDITRTGTFVLLLTNRTQANVLKQHAIPMTGSSTTQTTNLSNLLFSTPSNNNLNTPSIIANKSIAMMNALFNINGVPPHILKPPQVAYLPPTAFLSPSNLMKRQSYGNTGKNTTYNNNNSSTGTGNLNNNQLVSLNNRVNTPQTPQQHQPTTPQNTITSNPPNNPAVVVVQPNKLTSNGSSGSLSALFSATQPANDNIQETNTSQPVNSINNIAALPLFIPALSQTSLPNAATAPDSSTPITARNSGNTAHTFHHTDSRHNFQQLKQQGQKTTQPPSLPPSHQKISVLTSTATHKQGRSPGGDEKDDAQDQIIVPTVIKQSSADLDENVHETGVQSPPSSRKRRSSISAVLNTTLTTDTNLGLESTTVIKKSDGMCDSSDSTAPTTSSTTPSLTPKSAGTLFMNSLVNTFSGNNVPNNVPASVTSTTATTATTSQPSNPLSQYCTRPYNHEAFYFYPLRHVLLTDHSVVCHILQSISPQLKDIIAQNPAFADNSTDAVRNSYLAPNRYLALMVKDLEHIVRYAHDKNAVDTLFNNILVNLDKTQLWSLLLKSTQGTNAGTNVSFSPSNNNASTIMSKSNTISDITVNHISTQNQIKNAPGDLLSLLNMLSLSLNTDVPNSAGAMELQTNCVNSYSFYPSQLLLWWHLFDEEVNALFTKLNVIFPHYDGAANILSNVPSSDLVSSTSHYNESNTQPIFQRPIDRFYEYVRVLAAGASHSVLPSNVTTTPSDSSGPQSLIDNTSGTNKRKSLSSSSQHAGVTQNTPQHSQTYSDGNYGYFHGGINSQNQYSYPNTPNKPPLPSHYDDDEDTFNEKKRFRQNEYAHGKAKVLSYRQSHRPHDLHMDDEGESSTCEDSHNGNGYAHSEYGDTIGWDGRSLNGNADKNTYEEDYGDDGDDDDGGEGHNSSFVTSGSRRPSSRRAAVYSSNIVQLQSDTPKKKPRKPYTRKQKLPPNTIPAYGAFGSSSTAPKFHYTSTRLNKTLPKKTPEPSYTVTDYDPRNAKTRIKTSPTMMDLSQLNPPQYCVEVGSIPYGVHCDILDPSANIVINYQTFEKVDRRTTVGKQLFQTINSFVNTQKTRSVEKNVVIVRLDVEAFYAAQKRQSEGEFGESADNNDGDDDESDD